MADTDWKVTLVFVESATGRLEEPTFCVREHCTVGDRLSASTVADDLGGWLPDTAKAMATSGVKLTQVRVNRGGPFGPGEGDPPEAGVSIVDTVCTGAWTTGELPHGVCARVSVYTDLASRRGRGRFHAPSPVAPGQLDTPDRWVVGGQYLSAVQAFADELLGGHDVTHDLNTHHYSLRVHSRADAETRDATRIVVQPEVSYLRSRISAP